MGIDFQTLSMLPAPEPGKPRIFGIEFSRTNDSAKEMFEKADEIKGMGMVLPTNVNRYYNSINKLSFLSRQFLATPLMEIPTSPAAQIPTSPVSEMALELYALLYRDFDLYNSTPSISGLEDPQVDSSIVVGQTQIQRIITDIYNDNSLFATVKPHEFEEVIAELLRHQGYEVQLTKHTRDGGYDIIALANLRGNIPFKMLVECKRHKNKVGVGVIRSFKEVVMSNNANLGLIATTGLFTSDAWKKREQTPYLLDFRDRQAIIKWVEEYMAARTKAPIIYLG
jgi:HJR/Mrr/RecB family endonuclease